MTESFHRVGLPDSNYFLSSNPALQCMEPQDSLCTCDCGIVKMYRFIYIGIHASGRNLEQIEFGECLLLFGAESFIFHFAIQKV